VFRKWIFKLDRFCPLSSAERDALQGGALRTEQLHRDQDIRPAGDATPACHLVVDGFACDYTVLADGGRQIVACHIPGDFCDLGSFLFRAQDHSVAALSTTTVAVIQHQVLLDLAQRYPRILFALWQDTLVDMAVHRQALINIGRRNAYQRIAHFLCELCLRLQAVGLAQNSVYDLPLTQADLGDALGLSVVHVNRTLQLLRAAGLISWRGTRVTVQDPHGLERVAGFEPAYLKLHATDAMGLSP